MSQSRVTSKNQTTVPRSIREALGIGAGDVLLWEAGGGRVEVSAAQTRFLARKGSIPVGKGSPVADVRRARALRGREGRESPEGGEGSR